MPKQCLLDQSRWSAALFNTIDKTDMQSISSSSDGEGYAESIVSMIACSNHMKGVGHRTLSVSL